MWSVEHPVLKIDPWCCYFAALLILLVPMGWIAAAVSAAVFHEFCHIAAILLLGDTVHTIAVHPWGITIEASFERTGKELLAALAGPLGSFFLVSLCHVWPNLALCAFAQGMFNMIPVYPMDGGRALQCLLTICFPDGAERIFQCCSVAFFVCMLVVSVLAARLLSLGILPVVIYLILLVKVLCRKIPCKPRGNRVQ